MIPRLKTPSFTRRTTEIAEAANPMLSSGDSGDPEPQWLKTPPQEERNNRRSTGAGGGEDATGKGSRMSMSAAAGRGRRSNISTYDASEDEDEKGFEDDCCCCPMDPVLLGIAFFHGICICLGIAGIAVNIHHIMQPNEQGLYQDIILRSYSAVFCVIMVFCELDWRWVLRRLRLLDIWFFRGLFYIYIGLQTIDKIGGLTLTALSSFDDMVGVPIIIAGAAYVVLGACCVKSVAESKRRRERMQGQYRELDPESTMESV